MDLHALTIKRAAEMIKSSEISSTELTRELIARIDTLDGKLNSYITVLADDALKAADEADRKVKSGEPLGALHGVPISVKDIFVMQGSQTTCGSKILQGFKSPYNATVIDKLLESGAVILGKNNMDEFAMGSSTETSYFGQTKNPWDLDRVPGGSSGGSAACVAASLTLASVGTDTGGSIRQPASFCGVVGLKPTYGRVSRYGMVAFASSLDQAGPLTKTVEDAAIILNIISGPDKFDSTSAPVEVPDFTESLTGDVKNMRIGIPKEYFIDGINTEVEKAVRKAIDQIEGLGAAVEEISLPHTEYAVSTYYIIAPSEASSNLARFDGVRYGHRSESSGSLLEMYNNTRAEGFGDEVKMRIMLGTYALSAGYYDAYYLKALKVRTLIRQDFDEAFKKVDVILTPTLPEPSFRLGEKTDDPLSMYLSDILTIPCNLAGLPGISVPCGYTDAGLPIGLQVLGRPFDEMSVLSVAHAYECQTDWHSTRPAI